MDFCTCFPIYFSDQPIFRERNHLIQDQGRHHWTLEPYILAQNVNICPQIKPDSISILDNQDMSINTETGHIKVRNWQLIIMTREI